MEKIQEKYRNSVFQLICIRGIYDPFRPYLAPNDQKVRGTGFVVDIERGVIVTNAHVVSNAFSIIGRTPLLGKRDLQLDLLSICRDRDLALVLIRPDDRINLINAAPGPLNMPFGDSMAARQTDQVLTIGYPLGQESIKFTTGVISGFQARIDEETSDLERDEDHPSYLVTTSPVNPGNSGGPLVNEKGEVIGIVNSGMMLAQNIGYAIASRNLLAIYPRMMSSYPTFTPGQSPDVVQLPKMSFNWNRTNQALIEKFGIPGQNAIYVSCTFPDSVLQPMEKGDLIRSLSYSDCFSNQQEDHKFYDVTQYSDFLLSSNDLSSNKLDQSGTNEFKPTITIMFDDYGDIVQLPKIDRRSERNLELKEIFDTIPIGTKLRFLIDRDQQSYYLEADYIPIEAYVTRFIYPRFEAPDYLIFAGICISPLTLNHVERDSNLVPEIKGKKRYRPHLVVTQVFPETSIYQMNLLKEGSIINRIQGQKVQTMEDLRQILRFLTNEDILTIEDKNGGLFAIEVGKAIKEDRAVMEKFKIVHDYIL
jgi:serine protease Do